MIYYINQVSYHDRILFYSRKFVTKIESIFFIMTMVIRYNLIVCTRVSSIMYRIVNNDYDIHGSPLLNWNHSRR